MVDDDRAPDPFERTEEVLPEGTDATVAGPAQPVRPASQPRIPKPRLTEEGATADPNAATAVSDRRSRASISRIVTLSPGDLVANRYKIKKMLGHGGMGDVYEATDTELRTDIALKTVRGTTNPQRAERFRREIFLARKVTHPNVCRVFDIGRHTLRGEEILFITMELLRGESLDHRLKAVHKLSTTETFGLVKQVASAIEAAHDAGVVHRDLKPANVMLLPGDDPTKVIAKVTDFGVAHAAGDPFEDVSGTGDIVGSPAYMSPEQVEGLEPSPRADIYALGIMIYEMVTGVRPFHGESSLSSAVKRLKYDPEPPSEYLPDISPIWEAVIMRCLMREPSERYQTVGEVVTALSGGTTEKVGKLELADLQSGVHGKPAVVVPTRKRKDRWIIGLAAGGIGLAALGLFIGRSSTSDKPAPVVAAPGSGSASTPPPSDAAAAGPTMLAVLPFANRSANKDHDYLADGITDELLVLLGKVPRITVIGRTSAFALKDSKDDATAIGRKLGVSKLIEGSVTTINERVRVTVRLVDTADGRQLWSESYDRTTSDLFAMQDEIAAAVARALAIELAPISTAPGERTAVAEAHRLLLRGRAVLGADYDETGLKEAAAAFERAVALDPNYAAALAELAVCQYWLRDFAATPAEADRLAKRALALADQARVIGPDVGAVHAARGFLFYNLTWDWASSRAELERAIELEPGNRETLRMYSQLLALLGESDKAHDMIQRSVAVDPLSARTWNHLAYTQTARGDLAGARQSTAKALELNPTSNISHLNLGTIYLLEKNYAAAAEQAKLIPLEVYRNILSAMAEHSLGNKAKADALLADLIKTHRHTAAFQIAEIYAWRGETDRAFEWLDNAVAEHDAGLSDIRDDVLLDTLRTDPRYRALLTKLGL